MWELRYEIKDLVAKLRLDLKKNKWRGQDSNLWPLGYEPNELPAAPPRDIYVTLINRTSMSNNNKTFLGNFVFFFFYKYVLVV